MKCLFVKKVILLIFIYMGNRYKIRDQEGLYFVTFTVVGWVDLFVRNSYRDCIIGSFEYCQEKKGLNVYAFVIMTSHIHAILSAHEGKHLTGVMHVKILG